MAHEMEGDLPEPQTPKLRGVFHLVAFLATPAAVYALIQRTSGPSENRAVLTYCGCMALTLGASASYHIPRWRPRALAMARRFDHAAIFALIYGTYVPICRVGLPATEGEPFLSRIGWACAAGAAVGLLALPLARVFRAGLFLMIGWSGVTILPAMWTFLGAINVLLFVAGGIVYSLGAIAYWLKRPNPRPATFGYHEVFHVLVLVACALHYVVVWNVVSAGRSP